jgi:sugar/nucleoside kinase (ribokinase family)
MDPASVSSGGSVSNTGLALKVLGNDVTLMGKVGDDDFGAMLAQIYARYGAEGLLVDPDSATSYSVVLAIPGIDRMFLHCPGANNSFSNADIPDGPLEDAVLFHFGYPTLMKKMYEENGKEMAAIFKRVKSKGIATSLDLTSVDPNSEAGQLDWVAILKNVLPYVDFFVPSFEEICFMLDRPLYERLLSERADMTAGMVFDHEVKPLADKLIAMGCKTVLIKCGISGMYYRTASRNVMAGTGERIGLDLDAWSEKEGVQPCFKADIVRSGTGAGDTSIAAFLTAALDGEKIVDCVAIAAAEGACCVTSYDALGGLKSIKEIKERIASGWETL